MTSALTHDIPLSQTKLMPKTVELDHPDSGKMPHVCLGGTKTRVGELKSQGGQVDESSGHVDESKGQTIATMRLNIGETITTGNGGGTTGARSGTRDARPDGAGPDDPGNWSDALSEHKDVPRF